jgi:hypothetical protein
MKTFTRVLISAALLVMPVSSLHAQTGADPSGHWEGAIQMQPNMAIQVEIDLAKNGKGELAGTFGQPAQQVKGIPLFAITVEGRSVSFVVKGGPESAKFQGTLSSDGKSISGDAAQGAYNVPFTLTRSGDARIAAVPGTPNRQGA